MPRQKGVDWSACLRSEPTSKKEPDWLQTGDILVAARGSTNYAVLVDTGLASLPAVAAPHFYVVRLHSEALSPEFLAWQLNQSPCQRYFELHAEGSAAKVFAVRCWRRPLSASHLLRDKPPS